MKFWEVWAPLRGRTIGGRSLGLRLSLPLVSLSLSGTGGEVISVEWDDLWGGVDGEVRVGGVERLGSEPKGGIMSGCGSHVVGLGSTPKLEGVRIGSS